MKDVEKTFYPIPEEKLVTPKSSDVSYTTKKSNKENQEKRGS